MSVEDLLPIWRTRIEDLATRLMIEGNGQDTIDELRLLKSELERHKVAFDTHVLDGLIGRLDANLEDGAAYLLKSGFAELQAALVATPDNAAVEAVPSSLNEDAELIADFLVEGREHLSQIEGQMLVLERDPSAMEVIHAVFRAFHTIKGLAGFLDFKTVQALAHEVESLLDLARNAKLVIDPPIVDIVLESGDALQNDFAAIERALNSGGSLTMADHRPLMSKIRALAVSGDTGAVAKEPVIPVPELVVAPEPVVEVMTAEPQPATKSKAPKAAKASKSKAIATPKSKAPEDTSSASEIEQKLVQAAVIEEKQPEAALVAPAPVPVVAPVAPVVEAPASVLITAPKLPMQAAKEVVRPAAAETAAQPKEPTRSADSSSVRVETAKLDHLMDMVGEIVIAQSLIRHNKVLSSATDTRLLQDLTQLARVTVEVQRATMSMRMVQVGQLFQRIERVIRDLSRKAGKQVVLETSGTDTELDKTVAEELSDPLLHMVRNSVDHGIEQAAERVAAGKTPEARIRLSARHQGGQVIIEISDDGRGLNAEKIRSKAEDRGLISPTAQMTDPEIYQLIFEPGFSTAEKITDVSGRGVGMDVVRRNVEKLKGRIETQSELGKGTTFALKLPLTLAIIDGLIVEVGTERYIIPLSGVREMFRPQPDALFTVEGRDEMLLVRGKLIPLVRLHQRLGIPGKAFKPSEGLIVVLESENHPFCLLVDDLLGKQEVVIKSLGEVFKDVSGLSGCAVLGDGHVGLILDVDGIYRGRR